MDPRKKKSAGPSSTGTICRLFFDAATRYPHRTALMARDRSGRYAGITYRELQEKVDGLAAALKGLGFAAGDRAAVCSGNRPEWAMADLAVLRLGGIVVPIYQTLPPAAAAAIINDSGSRLLFVQDAGLWSGLRPAVEGCPTLVQVVFFDGPVSSGGRKQHTFSDLLAAAPPPADGPPSRDLEEISPGDPATIVYTSGTTGEPKGAVLTHANIVSNALAAMRRFRFTSEDIILSYLPLCHMFERTCGYYTFLFAGACIAYARDLTTIVEDIKRIRPTILIAVPRIIEKVHQAVAQKVRESSALRRRLVSAAVGCLKDYHRLADQDQRVPLTLRLRRSFYDRMVASKFRRIAGGRLRLLVSGGAALDITIEKLLHILGFNIIQGYGLTETSPVVTCRSVEDNRLGTVGKPLDGVEARIGENDEILVRGPNVMREYFGKPEQTSAAIDREGWFHTGDQGRFDDDGNLIITGRIKELLVTSYGKNVAPVPIERLLAGSPCVEQSILIGDGRNFLTALIVPRLEAVRRHAAGGGATADDETALLKAPATRELFAAEIARLNAELPRHEQIKDFILLEEPFTVGNGLLTPTLKVRRGKVLERYQERIEKMYRSSSRR
jgi:long-chain acyl-CoA synthetase